MVGVRIPIPLISKKIEDGPSMWTRRCWNRATKTSRSRRQGRRQSRSEAETENGTISGNENKSETKRRRTCTHDAGQPLQRNPLLVTRKRSPQLHTSEIWDRREQSPQTPSPRGVGPPGGMQYTESRWLIGNGHERAVEKESPALRQLLSTFRRADAETRAVILHEWAHGYHDQISAFDTPEIIAVYEQRRQSASTKKVMLYTGEMFVINGIGNQKEYFAEGNRSVLFNEDFLSVRRCGSLREHDPDLHSLLQAVCGRSEYFRSGRTPCRRIASRWLRASRHRANVGPARWLPILHASRFDCGRHRLSRSGFFERTQTAGALGVDWLDVMYGRTHAAYTGTSAGVAPESDRADTSTRWRAT